MKDKEKQIEEMAIEDIVKIYPEISRPTAFGIINVLKIKYGKPKLPKDSVVLSREEWEAKLDEQYEKGQLDTRNDFDGKIVLERERFEHLCDLAYFGSGEEEIRKETAEKIFLESIEKVKERFRQTKGYSTCYDIVFTLMKLAKQFGVEIKE